MLINALIFYWYHSGLHRESDWNDDRPTQVAVSHDRDNSDKTATKQFLFTWILFNRQI